MYIKVRISHGTRDQCPKHDLEYRNDLRPGVCSAAFSIERLIDWDMVVELVRWYLPVSVIRISWVRGPSPKPYWRSRRWGGSLKLEGVGNSSVGVHLLNLVIIGMGIWWHRHRVFGRFLVDSPWNALKVVTPCLSFVWKKNVKGHLANLLTYVF